MIKALINCGKSCGPHRFNELTFALLVDEKGCYTFPDHKGKKDKYLAAVPRGRASLLFCNTEEWTEKELLDLAEAVKNLAQYAGVKQP